MLGPKRQHLEVRARQGKEQRGSGIGQTGRWGTTSAMDGAAQYMYMCHQQRTGAWGRQRGRDGCSKAGRDGTVVDASLSQWIGAAGSRCVSGRGLPQANPTDSCRADLRRLACGRVTSAV